MSYKPWLDDGKPVTVRRAAAADGPALERLAILDDAPPLQGELLVAEVEGEVRAALELGGGRVLGDPFRPTAVARELLALRARSLERAARGGGVRRLLVRYRPRLAR